MEEQIRQRIAELEKAREQFVREADQQIGAYTGAIVELKRLLAPKPAPTSDVPAPASDSPAPTE